MKAFKLKIDEISVETGRSTSVELQLCHFSIEADIWRNESKDNVVGDIRKGFSNSKRVTFQTD